MVFIAMAQSIYAYGIGSWGGAYNIYLNSLIKISFNKPYRMSTVLLYKECNLLNLNQLYARHILSNMFFLMFKNLNLNITTVQELSKPICI